MHTDELFKDLNTLPIHNASLYRESLYKCLNILEILYQKLLVNC